MSQTATSRHRHLTLNTDGRPHPLQNALAVFAAACAIVSAVSAWYPSTHLLGSWAGLVGLLSALWSQMISATTAERWINVCAMIVSGVGLLFGLGHGGLY